MASVSGVEKSPVTKGSMEGHTRHCREENENGTESSHGDDWHEVCQSCQHLYGRNGGVVLSPATLLRSAPAPAPAPTHTPPPTHTTRPRTTPILQTPLKLWKPRRYGGLCECGGEESGGRCRCQNTPWTRPLSSPVASYWPKVKVALLVIAAITPFVFLIAYLILTYTI